MFLSYKWGNWNTEKWSNLPKVTKRFVSRWSAQVGTEHLEYNMKIANIWEEREREQEGGSHEKQPHAWKDAVEPGGNSSGGGDRGIDGGDSESEGKVAISTQHKLLC